MSPKLRFWFLTLYVKTSQPIFGKQFKIKPMHARGWGWGNALLVVVRGLTVLELSKNYCEVDAINWIFRCYFISIFAHQKYYFKTQEKEKISCPKQPNPKLKGKNTWAFTSQGLLNQFSHLILLMTLCEGRIIIPNYRGGNRGIEKRPNSWNSSLEINGMAGQERPSSDLKGHPCFLTGFGS